MQVGEIMKTSVRTAAPDATFAEVARLMHDNHISSVIVMDGERLGVAATGASDCHGARYDPVRLGCDRTDPEQFAAVRRAARLS